MKSETPQVAARQQVNAHVKLMIWLSSKWSFVVIDDGGGLLTFKSQLPNVVSSL